MNVRVTSLVSLLFLVACTSYAEPKKAADTPPDPILGKWIWQASNTVILTADGKAAHSKGFQATWKYMDNKELERKYEFIWDNGIFIDKVRLSRDGKKLEGKDKNGKRTWADRAPAQ